ncbi:MAG: hypothetical protein RMJ65_07035, partial [candidate division WOR-3 bacterium]|nr:hypothetical protein [candidate division WOR-3 bacterium]
IKITDKETEITSKYALFYEASNYAYLYDSVKLTNPKNIILSDTLFYDFTSKVGKLSGNVLVQTETLEISAPKLIYFNKKNYIEAESSFTLKDKIRNLVIEGQKAYYDLNLDLGEIKLEPKLYIIRTDTLQITSKKMQLNNKAGCFYAYDSVCVLNSNSTLYCETLAYFINENIAQAYGRPQLYDEKNFLKSRIIRFYLAETNSNSKEVVRTVEAWDDILVRYITNEQGVVEISGARFVAHYEHGALKEIFITAEEEKPVSGEYRTQKEL